MWKLPFIIFLTNPCNYFDKSNLNKIQQEHWLNDLVTRQGNDQTWVRLNFTQLFSRLAGLTVIKAEPKNRCWGPVGEPDFAEKKSCLTAVLEGLRNAPVPSQNHHRLGLPERVGSTNLNFRESCSCCSQTNAALDAPCNRVISHFGFSSTCLIFRLLSIGFQLHLVGF